MEREIDLINNGTANFPLFIFTPSRRHLAVIKTKANRYVSLEGSFLNQAKDSSASLIQPR